MTGSKDHPDPEAPQVGQADPAGTPPANQQFDQELAGESESACPTVFHEVSRAERPFKQTTKGDGRVHDTEVESLA